PIHVPGQNRPDFPRASTYPHSIGLSHPVCHFRLPGLPIAVAVLSAPQHFLPCAPGPLPWCSAPPLVGWHGPRWRRSHWRCSPPPPISDRLPSAAHGLRGPQGLLVRTVSRTISRIRVR